MNPKAMWKLLMVFGGALSGAYLGGILGAIIFCWNDYCRTLAPLVAIFPALCVGVVVWVIVALLYAGFERDFDRLWRAGIGILCGIIVGAVIDSYREASQYQGFDHPAGKFWWLKICFVAGLLAGALTPSKGGPESED